jgi:hypothetical protein
VLANIIEQYLPFYPQIKSFIEDQLNLDGYIQQLFDFINSLDAVTLVLGTILVAIILLMGTLQLLKKLSKLILTVGILAGLWFLYTNGAFNSLLGK